jgi:hypothetical protein
LHKSHRTLLGAGIEFLADGAQPPVVIDDEAAVAGRVIGLKAQDCKFGAAFDGCNEAAEGVRPDERHVAIKDERDRRHFSAGSFSSAGLELRRPHPRCRAVLLNGDGDVGHRGTGRGCDLVHAGADDGDDAARFRLAAAARTCPSRLRPAAACSTLGRLDFMRVPSPAASTMQAMSVMAFPLTRARPAWCRYGLR